MEKNVITSLEKKPSYIIELEKVYNKYLSWDRSNFPYGFKMSYADNISGARVSVERKFNHQKLVGAEVFRENYIDCLATTDPSLIKIEEYNGTNRNSRLISNVPITIRIVADAKAPEQNITTMRTAEPSAEDATNKQIMGSVLGIMGIDVENTGQNGHIGAVLAVQQQMFEKSTLINNLNQELQRVKFDLSRQQYESDAMVARVKDEHLEALETIRELEDELDEQEQEIAELTAKIEELNGVNENHVKNGSLQKMGVGAITQLAFQLVKRSPKLQNTLGIAPDQVDGLGSMLSGIMGVEEPQQEAQPAPRRKVEPEEQLDPKEQERIDVINIFSKELKENWKEATDILRLIEISRLLFGNEAVQTNLIKVLKDASLKAEQTEVKAEKTTEETED